MDVAKEEGATIATGGKRPERKDLQDGFFFEPTVITDCDTSMRIVQEEVFGPVVTVEGFEDEADAVRLANDSIYGLAGAVCSLKISAKRNVSLVACAWVQFGSTTSTHTSRKAPWGGYKQSGIGRELGKKALKSTSFLNMS